jgi:porphobilinogen deaminase
VLATLEGGCSAPIGTLAEVVEGDDGDELWVRAVALSPDGALAVRRSASGSPADAVGVGTRLAEEMLAEGARDLVADGDRVVERPGDGPDRRSVSRSDELDEERDKRQNA